MNKAKKIFSVLAVIAILLSAFPIIPVFAETESGECGENTVWEYDSKTLTLNIKTTLDGWYGSVENYSDNAKAPWYEKKIETLVIGDNVFAVGKFAFADCNELKNIVMPHNYVTFEEKAFAGSYNDKNVYINDWTDWTGFVNAPFYYDLYLNGSKVTDLNLPTNMTYISSYLFSHCKSLISVNIPKSVKGVGMYAFSCCPNLKEVYIASGDSITPNKSFSSFGMFEYCLSLEKVILPPDCTVIPDSAFYHCDSLESLILPYGIEKIGVSAFHYCEKLRYISIPETVRKIGYAAFFNCVSLSDLIIPKNIFYCGIGRVAFGGCSSLAITVPSGNILEETSLSADLRLVKTIKGSQADKYAKECDIPVYYLHGEIPVEPKIEKTEIDFNNKIIGIYINKNEDLVEYSADLINWQDSNYMCLPLKSNWEYTIYQRYKKVVNLHNESLPSEPALITTKMFSSPPQKPALQESSSSTISLERIIGYEYKIDNGEWQGSNIFTGLQPNSTHNLYQRIAETDTVYASEPSAALTVTTLKNSVNCPDIPTVFSVTSSSVIFKYINGYEYSIGGKNWQSSNVFTGLKKDTEYTFYQRIAETDTTYASESSAPLKVRTYFCGDINGDGKINSTDLAMLRNNIISGNTDYAENPQCDIKIGGKIDILDLIKLKKLAVEKA